MRKLALAVYAVAWGAPFAVARLFPGRNPTSEAYRRGRPWRPPSRSSRVSITHPSWTPRAPSTASILPPSTPDFPEPLPPRTPAPRRRRARGDGEVVRSGPSEARPSSAGGLELDAEEALGARSTGGHALSEGGNMHSEPPMLELMEI